MRIAISIEHAFDDRTGTGVFVSELVKGLARVDKRNDYTLFTSKDYRDAPGPEVSGNKRFQRKTLGLSHRMSERLWFATGRPTVNRYIGEHDVFHSLTPIAFPARRGKYVVTIHDLSYMLRPDMVSWRHRLTRHVYRWRMVRQADHFVAISEWTKRDIVEHMGVKPEKVTVILEGARNCFRVMEQGEVKGILEKLGVAGPYFLVPGIMNLRKNTERVVRSFARVRERSKGGVTLVFAGPRGTGSEQTESAARELGLGEAVKFLGFISDEELAGLMNGATAMVLASHYEGFGLPIVEAMASGTAVITSNVSSMPEVAGDAGLLVDPMSEESIAEAMWTVLTDEKSRRELLERGRKRARLFTWDRVAEEHVKLYESLA